MSETGYNIHDILTVKIRRNRQYPIRDKLNMKYSYFRVPEIGDPDITLNVGKFEPKNNNCYIIDHKYHIKENYLYCKESIGNAKWEVEVQGLDEDELTINFFGSFNSLSAIPYPDFLAQNILLKFIEFRLCQKGYLLCHAAGICKDNKAHIFIGRGGTFKTTLCMDLIREKNFHYLGDDRVIIGKNRVFSFPINLEVFEFMCEHLKNENSWNLYQKARFIAGQLSRGSSIDVTDICIPNTLYMMTRANTYSLKPITCLDDFVRKMVINNRLEDFIDVGFLNIKNGPFYRYLLAYSNIFPESEFSRFEERLKQVISNVVSGIPCFELTTSKAYERDVLLNIASISGE